MNSPLDPARSRRDTPKSFRRLLLPLFVPVTPLGAHSYKKMGGVPQPVGKDETSNTGLSLSGVSQNGTHRLKPAVARDPVDIVDSSLQCFLSLTDFPRAYPQKTLNVFYHLQTLPRLSTSVFYHLQKRRGGVGGAEVFVGLTFRWAAEVNSTNQTPARLKASPTKCEKAYGVGYFAGGLGAGPFSSTRIASMGLSVIFSGKWFPAGVNTDSPALPSCTTEVPSGSVIFTCTSVR
jgi:hypothetical protein